MNSSWEAWLQEELTRLSAAGLERSLTTVAPLPDPADAAWCMLGGARLLNLFSNDYLGLSRDRRLAEAAANAAHTYGCGGSASRLVCGNHPLYPALEEALAAHHQAEAALVFPSGYAANVGTITALVGRGDLVLSDRLNHASIIDGIRLSQAEHRRFRHGDVDHLATLLRAESGRSRRVLIVTESVFSMDGDQAPLLEIVALKERYGALLLVDEAHAGGVLGAAGEGLTHALGCHGAVDLHIGTLSKAFGSVGGYVVGNRQLLRLLLNRARPLIFSTAVPPPSVAASLAAVSAVRAAHLQRHHLQQLATLFRSRLKASGLNTGTSATQIVPVWVGDNGNTLAFASALRRRGIGAVAIRPPTVPPQTARVRFSLTALLTLEQVQWAADQIIQVAHDLGLTGAQSTAKGRHGDAGKR